MLYIGYMLIRKINLTLLKYYLFFDNKVENNFQTELKVEKKVRRRSYLKENLVNLKRLYI